MYGTVLVQIIGVYLTLGPPKSAIIIVWDGTANRDAIRNSLEDHHPYKLAENTLRRADDKATTMQLYGRHAEDAIKLTVRI